MQLIAHSVATYAVSLKDFPKRETTVVSQAYKDSAKYHGANLFI
jgi:aminopeptidase Y